MSINEHGSNNKEEEEGEDDLPHQRRRVDETNNGDLEEILDVPRVIDFEDDLDQILKRRFGSDIESRRKSRRSCRE